MRSNENKALSDNERLLGALLRIPYQALTVRIQQGLVEQGHPEFHASHLRVLQHIEPTGSRLSDLTEDAQMTKQAINYLIEYLEEQGYVLRVADKSDGRAKIIHLTDLGRLCEQQAREIIKQTEAEWATHLGQSRMELLRETLRDLAALIETAS
ncbi:MarR family winged helix-turn-helix transcriptional regulator [Tengunoibacter tsumagoiensis]|uniref:MarR family transcriptional regulator n=1 Tax=Tengunoibacter tsumagoiensis TaxID=2014871 RepID=A0A402A5X3_9CHLR|nr:MarR family transcriptional regulator [Tengunoibacter tsumagoiensis]GCE14544.1 MarR family transcriptional regulator [Tengunoibacter tsumagoiensis]